MTPRSGQAVGSVPQSQGGGYVNTAMDEETSRAAAELHRTSRQPQRLENDYQQLPSRLPLESRLNSDSRHTHNSDSRHTHNSDSRHKHNSRHEPRLTIEVLTPIESRTPVESRLPGESDSRDSDSRLAADEAGSARVSWREELDSVSDEVPRHSRSFSDTVEDDREVSD